MSAGVQRTILDKLVSSINAIPQAPAERDALATWGKAFCRNLVSFLPVFVVKPVLTILSEGLPGL
jgi:hypothetical protein